MKTLFVCQIHQAALSIEDSNYVKSQNRPWDHILRHFDVVPRNSKSSFPTSGTFSYVESHYTIHDSLICHLGEQIWDRIVNIDVSLNKFTIYILSSTMTINSSQDDYDVCQDDWDCSRCSHSLSSLKR